MLIMGEMAKRSLLALKHLISTFFTPVGRISPMFTGLIVLSSKCMTLNSPSKSVLRIFILISIEGPSLSPYKGSSLHTSRSTISSVSRDSFHFYSGMMASDMGFFNIASCIHYASHRSALTTIGLPKSFWYFILICIGEATTSRAEKNDQSGIPLHTLSYRITKKHIFIVLLLFPSPKETGRYIYPY